MTETDKKCEELVLSTIHKTFPDHKFIGEEGSAAQASHHHQQNFLSFQMSEVLTSTAFLLRPLTPLSLPYDFGQPCRASLMS